MPNPSVPSTPPPRVPALSVVLAAPEPFPTIRKTVSHLRSQTCPDRPELVLVTPSRDRLGLDPEAVSGLALVTVVEVPTIASVGRANAEGIRHASAPLVALAEDHCFPDPDWAEHLI